ncbi:ribosomal-protein-alanine N-acetyltransferase [Planctopirus ephydatiae]|jgi:ribosomal-protein-alanine N-acetyltransferase|uniref:Ribosomal-protein-alanine N-acetyltransferase n=1 Tax=Planctopirus ephydatiae TaxID=2528019 RepID=A0A518GN87_9PLAN|nr:ribosomal protein S18-alanine N-acetyltransferase [Planctopirus ephydatiae]QDV29911.1 ribosomal-protein-alanine N-acetyltransferase [Planctopirus ephydatiae]
MVTTGKTTSSNPSAWLCDMQIRWMIRRDMPEVLEIEKKSFEYSWSEEDFLNCLRQRNCIGMVAEHHEQIVGYMVYELLKDQLHILNFAVAPGHRRQGVGTRLMDKLVGKLAMQRRQEITFEVRETNLAAQLFFKSRGCQAVDVLRGHYVDTDEDAYQMAYSPFGSDVLRMDRDKKNRLPDWDDDRAAA